MCLYWEGTVTEIEERQSDLLSIGLVPRWPELGCFLAKARGLCFFYIGSGSQAVEPFFTTFLSHKQRAGSEVEHLGQELAPV